MNREEYLELLSRLVADGLLTEEQAGELLDQFDGGIGAAWDLPLPQERAIRGFQDELTAAAIGALMAGLGLAGLDGLPSRGTLARTRYADRIQDLYEANMKLLAERLTTGNLTVAQWQEEMLREMQHHLQQQVILASGKQTISPRQATRIDQVIREQSAYLARFSDQIAGRAGLGSPLSPGYIGNRAGMYGGVARGLFFEEGELIEAEAGRFGPDWVSQYIARDDGHTCGPCHSAQGYYPIGTGPMPGQVCLGRNRCRCIRVIVHMPGLARGLQ